MFVCFANHPGSMILRNFHVTGNYHEMCLSISAKGNRTTGNAITKSLEEVIEKRGKVNDRTSDTQTDVCTSSTG
jgi:hypothetical protein